MVKKMIVLWVVLIMCLGLFAGCRWNKYNAELHYSAQKLMNADYLEANMTQGAYPQGNQLEDATSPATRTYIIKDRSSYDLAFSEFPKEIDFSKKMILVHFFTSSYPTSPYKLKKISITDDTLHIEFKLNKNGSFGVPDAGSPKQTCVVVLIDKLDISTAVFNQK